MEDFTRLQSKCEGVQHTDALVRHWTLPVSFPLVCCILLNASRRYQAQVPNTGKEVRFKIIRNIGTAFVRMGQFQVRFHSFPQH